MALNLRKILLSIAAVLLFIVILNLVLNFFRWPFVAVSPYEAVPESSAIIYQSAVQDSTILTIQRFLANLQAKPIRKGNIDSQHLNEVYNLLNEMFPGSHPITLFVPQIIGVQQTSGLYVFDLRNDTLNQRFLETGIDSKVLEQYNFNGEKYYSLNRNRKTELSFYLYRNLLVVSPIATVLEESITQLNNFSTSIIFDQGFKEIVRENQYSSKNILNIRVDKIPTFIKSFIKQDYRFLLDALPEFSNYMSIDLNAFAGYSFKDRKTITEIRSESPKPSTLLEVIPDNIGLIYSEKDKINSLSSDSIYTHYVEPWAEAEYAFTIMNPRTSIDPLLILKARDIEFAEHYLLKYGDDFGLLSSQPFLNYSIHKLLGNEFLNPYLRRFPGLPQNPYFALIDDYVVFAANRQSLEGTINKYIVGQNIQSEKDFIKWNEAMGEEANAFFYFDKKGFLQLVNKILAFEQENIFSLFSDFELPAGIFFSGEQKRSTLTFAFNDKDEASSHQAEVVWRTPLNGEVSMAPKVIWNDLKKEYEILVQDNSNLLYLLNEDGEIIWKRHLNDPILSDIYQVKTFDNNSYHLLFNTTNNIYLVDEKGSNVSNYPIKLQSAATNGLCMTDFYHDNNFQYFLSCDNGHAYGFSNEGNPIPGWNPLMNIGKTSKSFQHFQFQAQDYLIILNDKGSLAGFNSYGQRTFGKLDFGSNYASVPEIIEIGKRKVIALKNQSGGVKLVNDKGKAFDLQLRNASSETVKTTFANITGDKRKDYITLSGNRINGFQHGAEQLKPYFEIKMPDKPDLIFPVNYPGADYSFIGTLSHEKKLIHLFNASASLHPGFPLAGTTQFSICNLYNNQDHILIVGYENSVYTYRIGFGK